MSWTVHLSAAAQQDFNNIIDWTIEQFGDHQATVYAGVLVAAISELDGGPQQLGIKARDDIGKGMFTMHVARHHRKGRHFVMLRVADHEKRVIEVVRLLHDAMDLPRHLPKPG